MKHYLLALCKIAGVLAAAPVVYIIGNLYLLYFLVKGVYAITTSIIVGSINSRRTSNA